MATSVIPAKIHGFQFLVLDPDDLFWSLLDDFME